MTVNVLMPMVAAVIGVTVSETTRHVVNESGIEEHLTRSLWNQQ
jgi:hypothetical protein